MSETNYIQKNKSLWNQRTPWHVASKMYDVDGFLKGASTLKEIELTLLGDVKNKKILHLQCHFGMDTLSLARMGAEVTGVDFSEVAIEQAKELASKLKLPVHFICSDVYEVPSQLTDKFDVVFASYGVIGWLPDLTRWAQVITDSLKPRGTLVFAEFHPVVWMFDNDFSKIEYNYFKSEPIVEAEQGTYADTNAPITAESISWNHSLSEVFTALIRAGLTIEDFSEYNYSPFDCFRHTEEIAPGKFIIQHFGDKIPMVYALKAVKSERNTTTGSSDTFAE